MNIHYEIYINDWNFKRWDKSTECSPDKFFNIPNVLFWTPHGVCDPLLKIIALPEIIILRKARKRKTNTIWYHLHVESKIWHKWTYLKTETDSQT